MKTPRLRFGLRSLLLLPVLVAAFYGGWIAHDYQLRRIHRQQEAAALRRRTALYDEIRRLHDEMRRERARLLRTIEQVEHQERIDSFRSQLNDPVNSRMLPEGRFR